MAKKNDLTAAQVREALAVTTIAPRLDYRAELAPAFARFIAEVSEVLEKHGATLDRVVKMQIDIPATAQPLK